MTMGLFSFLSGKKKEKPAKAAPPPKAAAKPAAKVEAKKPEPAPAKRPAPVKAAAPAPAPVAKVSSIAGLAKLRAQQAAFVRAGDTQKGYDAAVKLVALCKASGSTKLASDYRAEADKLFASLIADKISGQPKAALAVVKTRFLDVAPDVSKSRLAAAGKRIGKPEAAKLIAAHKAFLAKAPRRARVTAKAAPAPRMVSGVKPRAFQVRVASPAVAAE